MSRIVMFSTAVCIENGESLIMAGSRDEEPTSLMVRAPFLLDRTWPTTDEIPRAGNNQQKWSLDSLLGIITPAYAIYKSDRIL
jgi:hypothetical protein